MSPLGGVGGGPAGPPGGGGGGGGTSGASTVRSENVPASSCSTPPAQHVGATKISMIEKRMHRCHVLFQHNFP